MRRTRATGEKGIAIIMTGLLLLPLMAFAAFGVDLASWYSRVSYLQKSADAAALAGTVWMPDLARATSEAEENLRSNGLIDKDEPGGMPNIDVVVERGSEATSLRVTVTDHDVTRYFSQVFAGRQELTRSAEATYNLPLPLGSPLNYFGGDHTRTAQPSTTTWSVTWPLDHQTREPDDMDCNVGTDDDQDLGRWDDDDGFEPGFDRRDDQCEWAPTTQRVSSLPTNGDQLAPENAPCNRQQSPSGTQGRWQNGTSYQPNRRFTGDSGNRQCVWDVVDPATLPPNHTSSTPPVNRPCNIPAEGRWPGSGLGGFQPDRFYNSGATDRLCAWWALLTSSTLTPPNPIDPDRSPGFWAAIEGPRTNAFQGDPYSTRCYRNGSSTSSCGSSDIQNELYERPDVADRGSWYVVEIPAGLSGSVDINVYDAAMVAGDTESGAGDRYLDGSSGGLFPTQFTVYEQTNPLDFTQRVPLFAGAPQPGDSAAGACKWQIEDDAAHVDGWQRLCTLTAVAPGDLYLVNVQTVGTDGAGVNGYALEAVSNGSHANAPQPALYAYRSMTMQNNNFCSGGGCVPPPATFYLAEVGPQHAGKTLVMELWDSGDVSGTAHMHPMMPATSSTNPGNPNAPRPVVPVDEDDCSFTADASPNERISGITGTEYTSPQGSDVNGSCGIRTSASGARFNGEWLRIRIPIPADYTCTLGVNPEVSGGSCWWGIRYVFGDSANDVTTWQARIEGNPVHLTE